MMDRREWLRLLAAGGAATALVGAGPEQASGKAPARTGKGQRQQKSLRPGQKMPAIFLAHGAPPLLDDAAWMAELHRWARAMPLPKAVLMLSAHWEERPVTIGATKPVPLIYDFYGFPRRYYEMTYAAPGAPALAERVHALVGASQPVAYEPARGLDHGAYVPLMAMYPEADVPVLQVSLPTLDATKLFELGRQLAPLRSEGVLIAGSGFLTHNLRMMDFSGPNAATPQWAKEFDSWNAEVLGKSDMDALLAYRERAPGVEIALPTHEHFVPVVVAAGAAADSNDKVSFPITGFWGGSFTKRSVQFG